MEGEDERKEELGWNATASNVERVPRQSCGGMGTSP